MIDPTLLLKYVLDFSVFDSDSDKEQCGIVILRGRQQCDLVRIPNTARQPKEFAQMLNKDIQAALVAYPDAQIIGLVHTHLPHHPLGPSPYDYEQLPDNHFGIVYNLHAQLVSMYDHVGIVCQTEVVTVKERHHGL